MDNQGFCPKPTKAKAKGDSGLSPMNRGLSMPVSKKTDPMHSKPQKRGTVRGQNANRK